MKTLNITLESGKILTYHGSLTDLMIYRMRIKENEERRERLGMDVDKAIKFETSECEY